MHAHAVLALAHAHTRWRAQISSACLDVSLMERRKLADDRSEAPTMTGPKWHRQQRWQERGPGGGGEPWDPGTPGWWLCGSKSIWWPSNSQRGDGEVTAVWPLFCIWIPDCSRGKYKRPALPADWLSECVCLRACVRMCVLCVHHITYLVMICCV